MKYTLLALVAVCSCLSVSAYAAMVGGTGVLLDVASNNPIPNAKIRLECRRNLMHGSRKVKDITVSTNASGKFRYESHQLSDCDFAYVYAEKAGYIETKTVDIRYMNTDYENLPKKVYMTPNAGSRMQHLRYLSALASGTSASKKYEYLNIYSQFYASNRIAETDQEKKYVYGQYCSRLLALFDSLNDSDKSWLNQNAVNYSWNNRVNTGKVDHYNEVVATCKSQ